MYKRIVLSRLPNALAIRFFKRTVVLLNETSGLPAAIVDETGRLLSITEALETLFLKDPASELTEVLALSDARRDGWLGSLFDMCSGYSRCPDESKHAPARAVLRLFEVYGGLSGITRDNYDAETTKIENFVADCSRDAAIRAALDALQLTSWVAAIEDVNKEFETMHQQRSRENADAQLPFKMLGKRKEGKGCYDDLLDMLEGAAKMARGAAPYDTLAARMNEVVKELSEAASKPAVKDDQ
ncbi:MAG: hypothetical protein EOO08_01095 [Chitinophagaceae bacterium]|nr:MAG: hypothetical protein EOO08_01095 [Chitinophagaceae bacterium]